MFCAHGWVFHTRGTLMKADYCMMWKHRQRLSMYNVSVIKFYIDKIYFRLNIIKAKVSLLICWYIYPRSIGLQYEVSCRWNVAPVSSREEYLKGYN